MVSLSVSVSLSVKTPLQVWTYHFRERNVSSTFYTIEDHDQLFITFKTHNIHDTPNSPYNSPRKITQNYQWYVLVAQHANTQQQKCQGIPARCVGSECTAYWCEETNWCSLHFQALFTRNVCVCVNVKLCPTSWMDNSMVPSGGVYTLRVRAENGSEPILCMCICITIDSIQNLTQTLTQTQTLCVNRALWAVHTESCWWVTATLSFDQCKLAFRIRLHEQNCLRECLLEWTKIHFLHLRRKCYRNHFWLWTSSHCLNWSYS